MKCVAATSLLAFVLAACGATEFPEGSPDGTSKTEIAIQRAVEAVYDGSSFEDPSLASDDDFRRPFTPDARLAFTRNDTLVVQSIDEYAEGRRGMLDGGDIALVHEWEIAGHSESFGNIAHRISSYAVHVNATDSIAERGVISFQLARVNGEWLVHSMIWDVETDDIPIPARYLER